MIYLNNFNENNLKRKKIFEFTKAPKELEIYL